MVQKQKCTQIQLTLHLILIFLIGVFVGTSLVTESDKLVSSLKQRATKGLETYQEKEDRYYESFKLMNSQYDLYKKYIYNGSEIKCQQLSNYQIDHTYSDELMVEFNEAFHKTPDIFMSINGFYYKPHLGLNDGYQQSLEFHVTEKHERYFKFMLTTSVNEEDFFQIEDFDRIDFCYFAFVKFDPQKDLQDQKGNSDSQEEDKNNYDIELDDE